MARQWSMMASAVSLAFVVAAVMGKEDDTKCCTIRNAMPSVFHVVAANCFDPLRSYYMTDNVKALEACAIVECHMGQKDMLNADKTVNEEKFKGIFKHNTQISFLPVMLTGLYKCLDELKEKPGKDRPEGCKSGSHLLLRCITNYLMDNCTEKLCVKLQNAKYSN